MAPSQEDIDKLLATIPSQVRGVGGAVAVVQDDGNVVSKRVWGFADLERGIPMQTTTQLPICSISKHMLCLVIADLEKRPTETMKASAREAGREKVDVWKLMDEELRRMLPHLFKPEVQQGSGEDRQLKIEDLFNMQSGIRDYWALTVLWGARAEDPFSLLHDAPRALDRLKSFHFAPGTEFSYSNVNFHVLGRVVEETSGHSLGQLLAERVFIPAGMRTAALSPNSMGLPLPIVGYEGSERAGYVPAVNGIEWQGDAGVTASLEDMVNYERWLQRSWNLEESSYRAIAGEAKFRNGEFANYSHGLWHTETGGSKVLSHTGGLRGFRLRRLHVPEKGLSVVVLLNHETDPSATSELILKPLLGLSSASDEQSPAKTPAKEWEGDFFDREQQRAVFVSLSEEKADQGKVLINYSGGRAPEKLTLLDETHAESVNMSAHIEAETDTLHLIRKPEGVDIHCRRLSQPSPTSTSPSSADYAGTYTWPEGDSTLTIHPAAPGETIMYASFSGFLGKGPVHLMRYVGEEVWILACPRSMDAPAPGEWTVVFRREGGKDDGKVKGVTVGCWLARRCEYVREE